MSSLDGWRRLCLMFKQLSRKYAIFQHDSFWALSCRSMIPQMCSIGLRSNEFGGQDINWDSALSFWNLPSRIRISWHRALSLRFFRLRRQTLCYDATGQQWCLDSQHVSWSILRQPQVSDKKMRICSKHNTTTIDLTITCCILEEKLLDLKIA